MKSYEGYSPPPPEYQQWQEELFGDYSEDPHDGCETIAISKYHLRPAAREASKFVTITWIDQDESGTYGPEGKRTPSPLPMCRKRHERHENPDHMVLKWHKMSTWQLGRFNGSRMIVTFKLTTEQGVFWQRSIGTAHGSWLGSSADPAQTQLSGSGADWFANHADARFFPYNFRDRAKQGPQEALFINGCYVPDLAEVTLGHPAARGCKGCFAKREDCPLLLEGSRYPCDTCLEDDIDCELIAQPLRKRGCLACGKKRFVCSYREEGSDHTQPCNECSKTGLKCVAGPLSGRTRTGPSLNQHRSGRGKGCNQCSQSKKWCSLKNKNPSLPCQFCRKNGDECNFEQSQLHAGKSKPRRKRRAALSGKGSTILTHESQATKPTVVIRTKLAHPVMFNFDADEEDPLPCHWCDDLLHGLLGLGSVDIEVIEQGDGKGYNEIKDGHTSKGHLPSRMCSICTLKYLMIAACKIHDIEPITHMDPVHFDYSSTTKWMEPGQARLAPFTWCSICPAPAFFRCCAEMDEIDLLGLGQDEGVGKGCGLLLCECCAVTLVNEHDGVLEGLIDKLKQEDDCGLLSLRADADFLHPNGELLRRMATD